MNQLAQEHIERRARLGMPVLVRRPITINKLSVVATPVARERPRPAAVVAMPVMGAAPAPPLPVETWPAQPPIVFYDFAPFDQFASAQAIFYEVCAEFGVTKSELRGRSRKREKVAARQKAAYRIRHEVLIDGRRPSLAEIGRIIGGFDHTTILYAIRAYAKAMAANSERSS